MFAHLIMGLRQAGLPTSITEYLTLLGAMKAGVAEYKRALPHWEKVQQELRAQFGNKRWNELLNLTNEVTAKVVI